ncbi:MAG: lipopolysaccharide heptosyltransferase II [Candidatus Omnitrophota bacterium]|jgi:heptosyltransferase-2
MINKILFITLSNIGDCILTLPVLDALRENFPEAKITVMTGPRPKEIFENNPCIKRLIIYDKRAKLREKIGLFGELKKDKFDLVVDLRNSLFGWLLPSKYRTASLLRIMGKIRHMKERHLYKIRNLKLKTEGLPHSSLYIKPEDKEYIRGLLRENGISEKDKVIVISPGARSHIKRWPADRFLELIPALVGEFKLKVILAGDKDDAPLTKYIAEHSRYPVVDLAGKTSIPELACLLKGARLCLTNDSALLHLASYLNIPVVAIFGPTSAVKYGPWSETSALLKKEIFCRPCQKAQCRFGDLQCMKMVRVEDALREIRNILIHRSNFTFQSDEDIYKRILVIRTDRIGDVLLSTPVIKVLRDEYPYAYLAMMVSPYAKDIVDGNPYLDDVIIYDKEGKQRSWAGSLKFAARLKKKKFDLAVILHPTNRAHLVAFLAGIPRRIGYDRKLGFLLTDRIKHSKQTGEKHELEYSLDLLRYLGIEPQEKKPLMPIKPESEAWVEQLLEKEGIARADKLLAVHPGASCPSKIWPKERFAQVADRLIEKYAFKVLVIAGPKDIKLAQDMQKNMHHYAVNLAGKTSVSQLASVLKRCALFISNDSGPVHIASAVGTPVISIFGRNQQGLSPKRWGPLGGKDRFLHKEVGCIQCLAHDCVKEFACLKAITVNDVVDVADEVLKT